MSLFKRVRRASAATVTVAIAIAIAASSLAVALIPAGDGSITACAATSGALRVIDTGRGATCNSNERTLLFDSFGGPAGGALAGNYPNPTVKTDSIGSAQLVTDSVGVDEICANCVQEPEIAGGAVRSPEILDGTILSEDIGASQVGGAQIADNSIDSLKLKTASVGTDQIVNNGVKSADIANGGVRGRHFYGGTYRRTATKTSDQNPFPIVTAQCKDGDLLLSGGTTVADDDEQDDATVKESYPENFSTTSSVPNGWWAQAGMQAIQGDVDGDDSATLTVIIYCLGRG
jgi:hypothetical protein